MLPMSQLLPEIVKLYGNTILAVAENSKLCAIKVPALVGNSKTVCHLLEIVKLCETTVPAVAGNSKTICHESSSYCWK